MNNALAKPSPAPRTGLIVRAAKALEGHERDVVIVGAAFILGALFTAALVVEVTPPHDGTR